MGREPVVIVGAGAAGSMAAIFAAEGSRPVLVLERTRDGGRKILVSGGGRCNVLPARAAPERFVTDSSPNTLRNLLLSWPLAEQRRFFEEEVGVALALEEETGKLFPASNSAREVRDKLVALARRRGASFRYETRVEDLLPPVCERSSWQVALAGGERLEAAAVIVATGGLSLPGTGSDGTGLSILERLGHTVHPLYPALTPLTAEPPRHAELAGLSLEVVLCSPAGPREAEASGGFLFTHRGYSGPAVLDLSHLAVKARLAGNLEHPIRVQWSGLTAAAWEEILRAGTGTVAGTLRKHLPTRLADTLRAEAGIEAALPLAQLRREERRRLLDLLTRYPLPWTGDEGYRKAEVTGGGVALSEVHPKTLESRLHRGLHLCGELLDTFGPIGGHNFLWAWATGRAAGRGAAGP